MIKMKSTLIFLFLMTASFSAFSYQAHINYDFPNELLTREPITFPLTFNGRMKSSLFEVKQQVATYCNSQFKVKYGTSNDFARYLLASELQRQAPDSVTRLTCLLPAAIEMMEQTGVVIQKLAQQKGVQMDPALALGTGLLRVPVIETKETIDVAISHLVSIRLFELTYPSFFDLARKTDFGLTQMTINRLPMILPWIRQTTSFGTLSDFVTQLQCEKDSNNPNCLSVQKQTQRVLQEISAKSQIDRSTKELFQAVSTGSIQETFMYVPQLLLFEDISSKLLSPNSDYFTYFKSGDIDGNWQQVLSLLQGLDVLAIPFDPDILKTFNTKQSLLDQALVEIPPSFEPAQMSFDYDGFQITAKAFKTIQIALSFAATRMTATRADIVKAAVAVHQFNEMKKAIYLYSNQECDDCYSPLMPWQQRALEIQALELNKAMKTIKDQMTIEPILRKENRI